jgi:hypothetical protein
MKKTFATAAAAALGLALALGATPANAYEIDSAGVGFVGKGEVQSALGINNAELQRIAAGLEFEISSVTESSATWTCNRDGGTQTQERSSTTTTTTQGVVESVARDKQERQVTGFFLDGLEGDATVTTEREGPVVGSCATGWTAVDLLVGDPVVGDSALYVVWGDVRVML